MTEVETTPAATVATKKAAPEVATITMNDGRIVEFAGKRDMLKTSAGLQTRIDFRNGESRLFTIPEAMINRFACHGAEQKLGDETAGLKDIEDKVLAIDELIDRLYAGEWGIKREAGGMAGTSVLAKALCEHTGKDREAIKKFLADKTQAQKLALRNSAKIKPIVERLEAEKAGKGEKVDTDALLGQLDG